MSVKTLCRNAYAGQKAWFCYHWRGIVTPGKEATDWQGDCEACAKTRDLFGEMPSFLDNMED